MASAFVKVSNDAGWRNTPSETSVTPGTTYLIKDAAPSIPGNAGYYTVPTTGSGIITVLVKNTDANLPGECGWRAMFYSN